MSNVSENLQKLLEKMIEAKKAEERAMKAEMAETKRIFDETFGEGSSTQIEFENDRRAEKIRNIFKNSDRNKIVEILNVISTLVAFALSYKDVQVTEETTSEEACNRSVQFIDAVIDSLQVIREFRMERRLRTMPWPKDTNERIQRARERAKSNAPTNASLFDGISGRA